MASGDGIDLTTKGCDSATTGLANESSRLNPGAVAKLPFRSRRLKDALLTVLSCRRIDGDRSRRRFTEVDRKEPCNFQ